MHFIETPKIVKEGAHSSMCINIEDELLQNREIFLTDSVDTKSMESLIKQLMYLYKEAPDKEITLYINSPGGEVQSGLAVYDFMKLIKAPIKTVCIGTAASMGAILFLAGDKREMMPNAQVMIHDPAPANSINGLKPAEISERLTDLKKVQKVVCDIISKTTGKTDKEVRNKTRKDSFFNAKEALDFGLATNIIKEI